jgi:hypothetical protein
VPARTPLFSLNVARSSVSKSPPQSAKIGKIYSCNQVAVSLTLCFIHAIRDSKKFRIVRLFPISAQEDALCLVAITSHGHRIYFDFNDKKSILSVKLVRECPPQITRPTKNAQGPSMQPRYDKSGVCFYFSFVLAGFWSPIFIFLFVVVGAAVFTESAICSYWLLS